MASSRSALIVASDTYQDRQLSQLRAPGHDAHELAEVLRDPDIGDFAVQVSINAPAFAVRIALEDFFARRSPEDVLLLHFSCHGIKDESGRLYFACTDTQTERLNSTGISADYVEDLLGQTRSRRVVLLIDCCFSGAFTRGMVARGSHSVDMSERLQGRGRAILTASSALEYAWEGDTITRLHGPSVFTSAVVQGLRTGEADRDGDQRVSIDELYDYVFDQVREVTPNQTPGKWSNVEGMLVIARTAPPSAQAAPLATPVAAATDAAMAPAPGAATAAPGTGTAAMAPATGAAVAPITGAATVASGTGTAAMTPAADAAMAPPTGAATVERETGAATVAPLPLAATSSWLAVALIAGGWMLAWLVSLALATSRSIVTLQGSLVVVLVAWLVVSVTVGAAFRWAVRNASQRSILLLGLGWPTCIFVGVVLPLALYLTAQGVALQGLAVAMAGALAAMALVAPGRAMPWERVLIVAAAWAAGWLWSGLTAWSVAFYLIAHGYNGRFEDLYESVGFGPLAAGGVLSGILGGIVLYLVLVRNSRKA